MLGKSVLGVVHTLFLYTRCMHPYACSRAIMHKIMITMKCQKVHTLIDARTLLSLTPLDMLS